MTHRKQSTLYYVERCALVALLVVIGIGSAHAAEAEQFFVSPTFDEMGRSSLTATERASNTVLRVFVEDAWWNDLTAANQSNATDALNAILSEFRSTIYPGLRAYYGEEANPGIDGDTRVVMLLSDLNDSAGGYFREGDQVSSDRFEESNERELVHLNSDLLLESDRFSSFLAHEFQHLISFNEKNIKQGIQEEIWLNEARSEYAPTVLGYDDSWFDSNLRVRAHAFFERPDDSLLEWNGADHDYAHVNMFAQYISEQLGSDIMARTMASGTGIAAVNDAIVKSGGTRTFPTLFADWAVANYINSIATNARWGYQRPELRKFRAGPTQDLVLRTAGTGVVSSTVLDWGARSHRLSSGGTTDDPVFEFEFIQEDLSDRFRVVYVLERNDGSFEVRDLPLTQGRGRAVVDGFGPTYDAVTVIAMSQTKQDFPPVASAFARPYKIQTERRSSVGFVLDAVTPSVVPSEGGAQVFIRGSGFTNDMRVFIDDTEASDVAVTGTTVLSFSSPAHAAGAVDVRVELPSGSSEVLTDALTYTGDADPPPPNDGETDDNNNGEEVDNATEAALLEGIEEGDLIRARGDIDVYIVKFVGEKRFKRLILNPAIFNSYDHFDWNSIKEVDPAAPALFTTSTLVRTVDDDRVFQLFPDGDEGEKRWLDISSDVFISSGRDADAIYTINSFERQLYTDGVPIIQ